MNKAIIFFFLLIGAYSVEAQTITLGPITKLTYCTGDTMIVPYQSSGTFNSGNIFTLQLSDSNGSFGHFSNAEQLSAFAGTFMHPFSGIGQHFRVRIISSDPYEASSDNGNDIVVSMLPSPSIFIINLNNPTMPRYWGIGLTGNELSFHDTSNEPAGSKYLWRFSGNPVLADSTDSLVNVIYDKDGHQSGGVFATNPSGCEGTIFSNYYIGSCKPTIPQSAIVVTGNYSTTDDGNVVWVKPGGTVTVESAGCPTVYAEPGSIVNNQAGECVVFYLRAGASLTGNMPHRPSVFILSSGMALSFNNNIYGIDTFYCDSLTFDYSQIPASVAENPAPILSLTQTGDHLFANSEETPTEIRIMNILGAEVLSQRGTGELDVDLSPLPAGVYFAQVQSGGAWEVKKIAVVH
jgi:hypothetical protein